VEALGEAVAAGRAEVGVQLHPWVSPPHDEEVNVFNSYAGNLPAGLEAAKFNTLRDAIETGVRRGAADLPRRALWCRPRQRRNPEGRGPCDRHLGARALRLQRQWRPCFRDHPVMPWWVDQPGGLMELPLTTVFWGMLRQQGPLLYPQLWRMPKLRGLLARMALLERIPLTPEGVSIDEAIKGIDIALDDGLPVLVFSFHSPSLRPGLTPYVRDEQGLGSALRLVARGLHLSGKAPGAPGRGGRDSRRSGGLTPVLPSPPRRTNPAPKVGL